MKIKIAYFYSAACYGGLIKNLSLILNNLDLTKFDPIIVNLESPIKSISLDLKAPIKTINLFEDSAFNLKIVSKLKKVIRDEGVQILSSHGYKANFYAGILKCFNPQQKITTIIHGWSGAGLKFKLYHGLEILFVRFFNKIVVLSIEQEQVLKRFKVNPNKLVRIPNGIDAGSFFAEIQQSDALNNNLDRCIIGVCQRLSQEKGHEEIIRAIHSVDDLSIECWIVGDGPERGLLEKLVLELGMQNQIKFFGHQKNLYPFYKSFDLYLTASSQEGMPNNILEAMSAKLPIIASDLDVHQELIQDQVSGLIYKLGDISDLAEKIELLKNDHNLRKSLGNHAYQKVNENYSLSSRLKKLEEVYLKC